MKEIRRRIGIIFCALLLLPAACGAESGQPKLNTVNKALAYVAQEQPQELDLGQVRMSPQDLWKIREKMPENSVLHFSTQWGGTVITDKDEAVNLNSAKGGVSAEALDKLVQLLPGVKRIDVSKHRQLSVDAMAPLLEKYPQVTFVWYVLLNRRHSLISDNTAYSSFNEPMEKAKLTSEQLDRLKYAPGIKALDLGHNKITSLDFLKYFPDIEFLILGDNDISDIEVLGTLKHLKYLEMFSVPITDISPLANCTELLDLNLSYCNGVTDLSPLDGLTTLERFWGNHMDGVSDEQKTKFIETHPQTKAVFYGNHATSDGWRDHDRFQHYRWCLHAHTWIPFDQALPK